MSSSSHVENPPSAVIKTEPDAPPPEASQSTPLPDQIDTGLADKDQEGRAADVLDSYESILKNLGYSDVLAPISEVTLDESSLPERVRSNPDMLLGIRTQIYAMELIRRMQNFQKAPSSHQSRPIMINGVTSMTTHEMPPLPSPDEAEYPVETKVALWLYVDNALSQSSVPRTASPPSVPSIMKAGESDDEFYDHDESNLPMEAALPLAAPTSSPSRRAEKSSSAQNVDSEIPTDRNRVNKPRHEKNATDDHDESNLPMEAALPLAAPASFSSRRAEKSSSTQNVDNEISTDPSIMKAGGPDDEFHDHDDEAIMPGEAAVPIVLDPILTLSVDLTLSSQQQKDDSELPTDRKQANPQKKGVVDSADDDDEAMVPGEAVVPIALAVPSSPVNLASRVDANLAPVASSSSSRRREKSNELPTDRKKAKRQEPPTDRPLFKCSFCKKVFNKKGNLNRHLSLSHKTKPYKCDHCPKRFQFLKGLRHHTKKRHDIVPTGANMGRPANKIVSKVPDPVPSSSNASRTLQIILTRCDDDEMMPPTPPVPVIAAPADPDRKNRHRCVCGKSFSSAAELKAHRQGEPHGTSSS